MNDSIEWEQSVWAVAPRDVISAVGVDTERYLHSQLSQQIEGLSDGDACCRCSSNQQARSSRLSAYCAAAPMSLSSIAIRETASMCSPAAAILLRVDVALTLIPADAATPHDVEHSRVAQGWPRGGHEIIAGETIPAELPMLAEARVIHEGLLSRSRARRANGCQAIVFTV